MEEEASLSLEDVAAIFVLKFKNKPVPNPPLYRKIRNYKYDKCMFYILCDENSVSALFAIPTKYRTKLMCSIAVCQLPANLIFVPNKKITQEMCNNAVSMDGEMICSVPKRFITESICINALYDGYDVIPYIGEDHLNENICMKAVEMRSDAISNMPTSFITSDLCRHATIYNESSIIHIFDIWMDSVSTNPVLIKELTEFMSDEHYIIDILNYDGSYIQYIPERFITYNICKAAVINSGGGSQNIIHYIPERFITMEICLLFVSEYGENIKHVPAEFLTMELCDLAVSNCNTDFPIFDYIPERFITESMCMTYIRNNQNFKHINTKFPMTINLWKAAIENCKNMTCINYIPKEILTYDLCVSSIINSRGIAIRFIPTEFRTLELYELANNCMVNFIMERFYEDCQN